MKTLPLLRLLALAGFVICTYLFIQKVTGEISSIAGCGTGSGCANVLGSRWSQFFGIPVSGLAAVMYAALLVATWKPNRRVFAAFAICFLGAAVWFVGILIFELRAFCPWCTAMHAIGVLTAVILIVTLRKLKHPEARVFPPVHFAPVGALVAILVLVLGQIFGPVPDTHLATSGGTMKRGDKDSAVHTEPVNGGSKGRAVEVYAEGTSYHTGNLPHVGPADAPHVMVKYFDYTCSSCLELHQDLEPITRKHAGKFCIILLPVPLNRQCNPNFPADLPNHEHACELARLSLAAWRADPESWPKVHEQLFIRPVLDPSLAEIAVAQIVGEEALAEAMKDPWIDQLLKANINDFAQLIAETRAMPKLLVGKGKMLHGVARSPEIFLQAVEQLFKLSE